MESREIRGSRTSVRETIGLIPGDAGTVVVVCDLVECVEPLTADKVRKNAKKAGCANRRGVGLVSTDSGECDGS
jgi:hypothetical protein